MNYTWQSLKDINQKRLHYNSITVLLFLVDNSFEISNISLTPRDFLITLKVINLILEDDC